MARGRAWGNALGGWRKQRRNSKGQFTKGGGGAVRKAVRGANSQRRSNKAFRKQKINRSKASRSIQRQHRAQVYAPAAAAYIGRKAGGSIGAAITPRTPAAGQFVGSMVGSRMAVGATNRMVHGKNSQKTLTPQKIAKLGVEDRVLIARRNHRITRAKVAKHALGAAQIAGSIYARTEKGRLISEEFNYTKVKAKASMRQSKANFIRDASKRAESSRLSRNLRAKRTRNQRSNLTGIPAPGKTTKLTGGNMNYARRAGRSRKNRNVFVVTTM